MAADKNLKMDTLESLLEAARSHFESWEFIFVAVGNAELDRSIEEAISSGELKNSRIMYVATKRGKPTLETMMPAINSAIGDRVTVFLDPPLDYSSAILDLRDVSVQPDLVLFTPDKSTKGPAWILLSKVFGFLFERTAGYPIQDSDFRIIEMSRKFAGILSTAPRPEATLRISSSWRGLSQVTRSVGFDRQRSAFRLSDQFGRALDTLLSASVRPLRVISFSALLGAAVNLFYSVYVLVVSSIQNTASGWASMSLQMSGMFFLTMLLLAALTELVIFTRNNQAGDELTVVLSELQSQGLDLPSRLNIHEPKRLD